MIPKKIYLNYVHEDDKEKTWCVDPVYVEDCEMQNREYIDLSQVWHPAEEEPRPYKDILTEKKKGFYVVCSWYNEGYGWKSYVKIFQLKRWAYIDDLLPKGGEE